MTSSARAMIDGGTIKAIEPAHRRQGEVLVLLGTNFDNPPAIRNFDADDEHHFFVWPIVDVTTFEGCGESAVRA
jgi:hypothetical protein